MSGNATLSSAVRRGRRLNVWKIKPIHQLRARLRPWRTCSRRCLATDIFPPSACPNSRGDASGWTCRCLMSPSAPRTRRWMCRFHRAQRAYLHIAHAVRFRQRVRSINTLCSIICYRLTTCSPSAMPLTISMYWSPRSPVWIVRLRLCHSSTPGPRRSLAVGGVSARGKRSTLGRSAIRIELSTVIPGAKPSGMLSSAT